MKAIATLLALWVLALSATGASAESCSPALSFEKRRLAGDEVVSYSDGTTEQCVKGDLFFWPAGHSVRVNDDAELIMFSPQAEHMAVMDHISAKLAG